MTLIDEAVVFSQTLVRAKSLTPDRTLCHALISERLQQSGFSSESLCYGDIDGVGDDAMVQNLWCHKKGSGTKAPLFCFWDIPMWCLQAMKMRGITLLLVVLFVMVNYGGVGRQI